MEDFEKKSIHNREVQYEKMRKMFAVLFASIVCLSGCFMPKAMYEQADADQVTAKTNEMMQT